MTEVAPQHTHDDPQAYIARDRRRALADTREMPDRVVGAALFADISGFTPLTEALAAELGPQRGAEELTANLGRVFQAVIDELDRRGGDVIYFSGDAITCWIDGDDGRARDCGGLAMQTAIAREGTIVTPGGTTVQLAMKVAVAGGAARRFVVGDPDDPADRRAGRPPDRRPGGGGALRREGRGRSSSRPRWSWLTGSRISERSDRRGDRSRVRGARGAPVRRAPASRSWSRRPSMRLSSGRGCCPRSTSGCARVAASS